MIVFPKSKTGSRKYAWLSPRYAACFQTEDWRGPKRPRLTWQCVEHFMAGARLIAADRFGTGMFDAFIDALQDPDAGEDALRDAQSADLDNDERLAWVTQRRPLVRGALIEFFAQRQSLCDRLLATGQHELVYASDDLFWGRDLETDRGLNVYGVLLADVRQTIRDARERRRREKTRARRKRRKGRGVSTIDFAAMAGPEYQARLADEAARLRREQEE